MKNHSIKNLTLLGGAGLLAAACGNSNKTEKDAELKNIVFLLADDLRWNSLGCMGTGFLQTPNIDRLASDGIRFTNAHVTTSISMVSRACILTGQYMSRHGISEFGKAITPEAFNQTYPALLRSAGFYSGFVGKYGIGQIRESDFDYAREYERVHWFPLPGGDSIHVTERNRKDALEFLKSRDTEKPFVLSVSFFATHAQDNHPDQYRYQPESEYLYRDVEIPVPATATEEYYRKLPPFIANDANEGRVRWKWRFDTPERYQKYMKAYYRMLTEMDAAIGDIVEELKNQGVYENTLIIFTGDNGYFHGEHQLADKWYPYEESVRVPLIIYDPRLNNDKRNTSNDKLVLNIDIAPTILNAAGLPVPSVMQGKDLSSLYLNNETIEWRSDYFYEHPFVTSEKRIPSSEALINDSCKYITWPHYEYEEYFDLKKDPYETNNSINLPDNKLIIDRMKNRLKVLRIEADGK